MHLCTFLKKNSPRIGTVLDGKVIDVYLGYCTYLADIKPHSKYYQIATTYIPQNMSKFFKKGQPSLQAANAAIKYVEAKMNENSDVRGPSNEELVYNLQDVKLMAPLLVPGKIICFGYMYPEKESYYQTHDKPYVFLKPNTAYLGPDEPIRLPKMCPEKVTIGVELAVVIGKEGKNIPEPQVYDHIAGYTILNDITAKETGLDADAHKCFDTFAPVGPWITLKEQIKTPHNLRFSSSVNGVVVQEGSTRKLGVLKGAPTRFDIPFLISFLSQIMRLEPGDIISTGDVGCTTRIKEGDIVEANIEKIGTLRNPVESEK